MRSSSVVYKMEYTVILLAAGSGQRANLGYNKVLFQKDGKTIIEYSIDFFQKDVDCKQIIVTYGEGDTLLLELLKKYDVEVVRGGDTRAKSVNNALQKAQQEYVFIHDGARPYLEVNDFYRLKSAVKEFGAAILGVPVIDTVKVVQEGIIETTPKRSTLWSAQTPQGFETRLIKPAYQRAINHNLDVTDDASVIEEHIVVKMVEGSYSNKKVTTPEDFI